MQSFNIIKSMPLFFFFFFLASSYFSALATQIHSTKTEGGQLEIDSFLLVTHFASDISVVEKDRKSPSLYYHAIRPSPT